MMTNRPPLWVAALDSDDAGEHQPPATKITDKARPSPHRLSLFRQKKTTI
ncbi:hypothetical protein Hanom_Chr03g00204631 [Helianthus anomalus]